METTQTPIAEFYRDSEPFQAAVAWYRLGDASLTLQSAVGSLDHPLVKEVDTLRTAMHSIVWNKCGGNGEKASEVFARAREFTRK